MKISFRTTNPGELFPLIGKVVKDILTDGSFEGDLNFERTKSPLWKGLEYDISRRNERESA